MIEIAKYVKAESLEEAYELNQKKSSTIIGGMLWLKMQKKRVGTAIDLSGLGLDTIEETEEEYRIGAMVTLRQIEQHAGLNALTCGAAKESVRHIVGVQFRNLATVGGSLFGRYGFSDVLTFFMAVGAKVELYHRGIIPVEEFARLPYDRDLLVRVLVPKQTQKTVYLSQRNTKTDFPVLTCCVCSTDEEVRCVIGARPARAVCLRDENGILKGGITPESAAAFGTYAKEKITTGSNLRGSSEYRSILTGVLAKRALTAIASMEGEE
ncbi:MAG: FAD binding domain-containing protein [Fusicatenibacter sp.]|nr:FAD binding domain-containing protein [Lachnospiraceae bacterium]MDY2936778.1 FAD binding domain-containing protein [Fusicatenibacter sp.]